MTHRIVKRGELFATFNFDGKDCADMGVYNVTSGAVYTMNLEPIFHDQTLEVPAYDGKYYYGTQITGQQFKFNCFCHDLVSMEYDRLRAWLHPRRVGRLILSDQPYKYYLVKVVSISDLGAFPLTTIQTPQHTLLGDYAQGDVVYTGNFTVTFETVGSAYGYGMSYYRDDLIYDAKSIYGVDYYYNSGILYRDMTPTLGWAIPANAKDQPIPIYNPGSAATAPFYCLFKDPVDPEHLHFEPGSYIQINNNTTGTSTVIDLSNISMVAEWEEGAQTPSVIWGLGIDMIAQTITVKDMTYYGRFKGSAMSVAPYRTVIEIPETFVENVENTNLIEYDTFYIENGTIVTFNPKVVQVDPNWVGYYFCCNFNGGSRILEVHNEEVNGTKNNYIVLEKETQDIPRPHGTTPSGIPYHFRGYGTPKNNSITNPQENDVMLHIENLEDGKKRIHCYVYMHRSNFLTNAEYNTGQFEGEYKWVETSYFSDENDFRDIYGDYQAFYKVFGATIIDLDDITISIGKGINEELENVGACTLIASMQPRYL